MPVGEESGTVTFGSWTMYSQWNSDLGAYPTALPFGLQEGQGPTQVHGLQARVPGGARVGNGMERDRVCGLRIPLRPSVSPIAVHSGRLCPTVDHAPQG